LYVLRDDGIGFIDRRVWVLRIVRWRLFDRRRRGFGTWHWSIGFR
jgi:hypothetical protein